MTPPPTIRTSTWFRIQVVIEQAAPLQNPSVTLIKATANPISCVCVERLMKLELLTREGSVARLTCAGEITPNLGPGAGNPMEDVLGAGCYGYKALVSLERATYIN